MNNIKVALAGQPNCGKSTIFNMVSGIDQHIANYSGVTVDKKLVILNMITIRLRWLIYLVLTLLVHIHLKLMVSLTV
ncbi:MAG: hypothetical protein E3J96_05395 [Sulfurovum sp.]|nr:MAG: hypothetical protein E3J96_05395 [Sulfurovum sp.]